MPKSSISFVCQECGYDSPKFFGKCPECQEWNSLKQISNISVSPRLRGAGKSQNSDLRPKALGEIKYEEKERINTGFSEMDGVLGGGLVAGSVTLIAGDPGIGKSTLLLQVAMNLSNKSNSHNVLYVSGEESVEQTKLRANRINSSIKQHANDLVVLSTSDTDAIVEVISKTKASLVIVDSIQTMESDNLGGLSGSVGQVRYAASSFIKVAKTLNIPIIIVGHVTKEGMVAGPMVLSHMVDTVLFLEGEKFTKVRILRSFKNRFGPIDEVGIFEMDQEGMTETKNPEQIFLSETNKNVPGSVFVATQEGSRSFLVEIQSLVLSSKLPIPRRVASGIDARRLELLLAVLQKHCNFPLGTMDVFVNIVGGLKISDPASDLSICLAIFSSLKNIALTKTVGIAEVGLLGELRGVFALEKRIREAKKLGFENIISFKTHKTLSEVIKSFKNG